MELHHVALHRVAAEAAEEQDAAVADGHPGVRAPRVGGLDLRLPLERVCRQSQSQSQSRGRNRQATTSCSPSGVAQNVVVVMVVVVVVSSLVVVGSRISQSTASPRALVPHWCGLLGRHQQRS